MLFLIPAVLFHRGVVWDYHLTLSTSIYIYASLLNKQKKIVKFKGLNPSWIACIKLKQGVKFPYAYMALSPSTD